MLTSHEPKQPYMRWFTILFTFENQPKDKGTNCVLDDFNERKNIRYANDNVQNNFPMKKMNVIFTSETQLLHDIAFFLFILFYKVFFKINKINACQLSISIFLSFILILQLGTYESEVWIIMCTLNMQI